MTENAEGRMCIRLGCPLRGEMTQEERCQSCNHFTEPWREQPRAESALGTVPVGIGAPGGPARVNLPGRRSTLKTLRYVRLGVILILIAGGLILAQIAKSDARKGAQPINSGNPGGPTATQPTAQPTQATQPTQTTEPTTAAFPASDQYGPIDRSKCPVTVPVISYPPTYAQLSSYIIAVDKAVIYGEKTRNAACLSEFMASGTPSPVIFDQPAQSGLVNNGLNDGIDAAGSGPLGNPDKSQTTYSGQELQFGFLDQNDKVVNLYGDFGSGAQRLGLTYLDTAPHSGLY